MTEIIDLTEQRLIRQTDENCRTLDEHGTRWFMFDVHYRHPDPSGVNSEAFYSFSLWATSEEDAKARLSSIQSNAEVAGRIISEYPA